MEEKAFTKQRTLECKHDIQYLSVFLQSSVNEAASLLLTGTPYLTSMKHSLIKIKMNQKLEK